jgi:septum site-determining protein MinC
MNSSNATLELVGPAADEIVRPAAILRGTARGLEVVVWGGSTVDAIAGAIQKRLDEAPSFFRGSDVRIRVDEGPLPSGCLTRLDELAGKFDLKIVEIAAAKPALVDDRGMPPVGNAAEARRGVIDDAVPRVTTFAAGSAPANPATTPSESVAEAVAEFDDEPTNTKIAALVALHQAVEPSLAAIPVTLAEPAIIATELPDPAQEITQTAAPLTLAATPGADTSEVENRIVIGPVRSGVILTHTGNLFIFGDVNPGAEVRATGNIIVLGRLRGTAHAGIGQDVGFVLALRLEPQQLRIGRMVARAADSDLPSAEAEIAYGTSDRIVVERYAGRLPRNLATSI